MADPFVAFGGVDFSGAREPLTNLWSAVGEERDGRLCITAVRPHAFRADLATYVVSACRTVGIGGSGPVLWGVDFPFGLPQTAGLAIGAGPDWSAVLDWVADRPPDEVRAAARDTARSLRSCDTGGALAPLDLRLYKQTVEGFRWLQSLRESALVSIEPQAPVPDADVALIEVYPSATSHELGLPRRRAPSRAGEARARAAALRTFVDFADANCEALVVNLEDAWDATIACLTAYLCRDHLDQPFTASGGDPEVVRREGWIFRPPLTTGSTPPPRTS
jgi:hypothetical protein